MRRPIADAPPPRSPGYHRFATFLAGAVIGLISAGALVTSTGAGLSVPDWPLSYGSLNPPRWWEISTVRAEHGHRLIAGTVALLTVALAVWISRREPRRWVRRLAWGAVVAVLAQALLGGITVLFFLPTAISVSHAALAELFLCLVVTLAVVTSPWWHRQAAAPAEVGRGAAAVAPLAAATTALVYVQILVGAVMRHSGAGLAIPDFPLAFGRLVPPRFDFAIGVHYAHRVGALLVTALVLWTVVAVVRSHPRPPRLHLVLLLLLVGVQIALGASVVITGKAPLPNTVHVATGATILATSLVLALRLGRQARASASALRHSAAAPVGARRETPSEVSA